jgi:hypothetical protein
MKYAIGGIAVLAAACILILGVGEFNKAQTARQQRQHTLATRSALAHESAQELARHYEECFPAVAPPKPAHRDAAYCLEVERETDARPLEAVTVAPQDR